MRYFKKIILSAITVIGFSSALLTYTKTPTSNALSSILLGDANGNGLVTSADGQFIQYYLLGYYSANDYQVTAMDINQDGLIDKADIAMIYYIDSTGGSSSTVNKDLYTAPLNESREYYRHNCQNNNTQTYNIAAAGSSSTNSLNSSEVTRTGSEYYDVTNNNIVQLTINGVFQGSGYIIGDHIIATAAHCSVYTANSLSGQELAYYNNIKVNVYNTNAIVSEQNLLISTDVEYIHIPCSYYSINNGIITYNDNYDYALLYVKDSLSSYASNWDFGVTVEEVSSLNKTAITSGYRWYNNILARYLSNGTIVPMPSGGNNLSSCRMFSTGSSYPGKSGGVVYSSSSYNNSNYKSAIAIVTGSPGAGQEGAGQTWSTRINPTLIRFYKRNNYLTE